MKRWGRILLLIVVVLAGCHHKRPPLTALPPAAPIVPAPPAPEQAETPLPTVPPLPQPSAPVSPVLAPNPLAAADAAFNDSNYAEAAKGYDKYLQAEPAGDHREEALFRSALSLALATNPNPDWTRITAVLKELLDHYPNSPFRATALVILSMESDAQKRDQRIKQLSTELDKLKQIDAERRKRPR